MPKRQPHREIFFAENGFGPYSCFFCDADVLFDEVHVHHIDEDDTNHDPSNLAAAHGDCHLGHHGGLVGGVAASSLRFECGTCGKSMHAGALATHQRYTGHSGKTKL